MPDSGSHYSVTRHNQVKLLRLGIIPIALSLGLHAVLIAVIYVSVSGPKTLSVKQTPRYIEAKLVKMESTSKKTATKKTPRKVDLTKRSRSQQKPAEKKAPAKNTKQSSEIKAKAAAEKKRLAAELAAKQEAQERDRRRQQLLQEMEESLEQEEHLIASALSEEEALSYRAAISRKIEQYWSRPPSARNGMTCELLIRLVPTGRVVSVTVIASSGNSAFDRSAESAVKKAEIFPELKDMSSVTFEKFYRELRLVFTPQDLRQ